MWCVDIHDQGPYWVVVLYSQDFWYRSTDVDKAYGQEGIDFTIQELVAWNPHI